VVGWGVVHGLEILWLHIQITVLIHDFWTRIAKTLWADFNDILSRVRCGIRASVYFLVAIRITVRNFGSVWLRFELSWRASSLNCVMLCSVSV